MLHRDLHSQKLPKFYPLSCIRRTSPKLHLLAYGYSERKNPHHHHKRLHSPCAQPCVTSFQVLRLRRHCLNFPIVLDLLSVSWFYYPTIYGVRQALFPIIYGLFRLKRGVGLRASAGVARLMVGSAVMAMWVAVSVGMYRSQNSRCMRRSFFAHMNRAVIKRKVPIMHNPIVHPISYDVYFASAFLHILAGFATIIYGLPRTV